MAKELTFDVGTPNPRQVPEEERVYVTFRGWDRAGNEFEPLRLRCMDEVQGAAMLEPLKKSLENEARGAAEITPFIENCLYGDNEVEAFRRFVLNKETVVPIEQLAEIMGRLMEVYSDRPTKSPSGSQSGQSTTMPTSMAYGQQEGWNTPQSSPPNGSSMPYTSR